MEVYDDMVTPEESKKLSKFLKWVGIAALAAVPVFLIVKKMKSQQSSARPSESGDDNIFEEDLSS